MYSNQLFKCLIFLILFTGCGNDESPNRQNPDDVYTSEIPELPVTQNIDLDNDGFEDFKIEYSREMIFSNVSDERIVGYFRPIGNHQVLHKQQSQNLFLTELSDIIENVNEPLFWNDAGWSEDIISIYNNFDGEWQSQWEPHHVTEQASYYLGFKLIKNNEIKIGWVELEFDLDSGETVILNSEIL